MAVKAAHRRTKEGRSTRIVNMSADEAYWAGLLAKQLGIAVADVLSPLIRESLRTALKKLGMDADVAWKRFESANRS